MGHRYTLGVHTGAPELPVPPPSPTKSQMALPRHPSSIRGRSTSDDVFRRISERSADIRSHGDRRHCRLRLYMPCAWVFELYCLSHMSGTCWNFLDLVLLASVFFECHCLRLAVIEYQIFKYSLIFFGYFSNSEQQDLLLGTFRR